MAASIPVSSAAGGCARTAGLSTPRTEDRDFIVQQLAEDFAESAKKASI